MFTPGLAIFYLATILRPDHVRGVRTAARWCLGEEHPTRRGLPRKALRNEVTSGGVSDHNLFDLIKFYLSVLNCREERLHTLRGKF
jgi:hypothetical protein